MGLQGWLDLGGRRLLGAENAQHSQEAVFGTQGRMVSSLAAIGSPLLLCGML